MNTGIETKTEITYNLMQLASLNISQKYVTWSISVSTSWRAGEGNIDTTVSKKSNTQYNLSVSEILDPIENLFHHFHYSLWSRHQSPIWRKVNVPKLPARPPKKSQIYHNHSTPWKPIPPSSSSGWSASKVLYCITQFSTWQTRYV